MSRRLPFVKMQGVGNDFVVLEAASWPADTDWPAQSVRLCDRKFGIGGDGLLVVGPSSIADVRMRMFNPDGTEDMCGNGVRCVVRLADQRGWLTNRSDANEQHGAVETLVGVRRVHVDTRSAARDISVEMGTPLFRPAELPMSLPDCEAVIDFPLAIDGFGEIPVTVVNTGTTHAVIWVDELPNDDRFFAISPRIENHPLFPHRTSVLWTRLNTDGAEVRIWERGAGETLGCGTGACAITVAAAVQGKTQPLGSPVKPAHGRHVLTVTSRGGRLTAGYSLLPGESEDPLFLMGPAEIVFTGTVPAE